MNQEINAIITSVAAIGIAVIGYFLRGILDDVKSLGEKTNKLETKVELFETKHNNLEDKIDDIKDVLKDLASDIKQLNKKQS
jgi:peptidoglycan hydrolase CwlO-like protein